MKILKRVIFAVFCYIFLFIGCTPRQAVKHAVNHEKCPPVSEHPGDTLAYTITFSDRGQRDLFVSSLQSFLDEYPFMELRDDTLTGRILLKLAPVAGSHAPTPFLSTVEPSAVIESSIMPSVDDSGRVLLMTDSLDTVQHFIDTIVPEFGGKVRLFTQRKGIDGTFLSLVTKDPFKSDDSATEPILSVEKVTPRKITVKINGRVLDGNGKLLSALDLIEIWTGYVKKHPAEGFALFRYVEGIKGYIQGREAVIRGFGAVDQKTCYLRLTQPDSMAVERISTPRLCGGLYSKLGPYMPGKISSKELLLVPNQKTTKRKAYLDTLVFKAGNDNNPILSFSLKKYDAITLTSKSDVLYARSNLENTATIQGISHDRYFVSCIVNDEKMRKYIASQIQPAKLLNDVVKAHGVPLKKIEGKLDTVENGIVGNKPVKIPPPVSKEIRILFRKDDMVSQKIAEKLLADLSGRGIRSKLIAAGITKYEQVLVEGNYECAIGWVPDRIGTFASERLRLVSIWFQDRNNEQERLTGAYEIPLFSVERYLLMRKPTGLYHNAVQNMYSISRPADRTDAPMETGQVEENE